MEWLLFGLGAVYLALLGFFLMGHVDRFCARGGIRPNQDAGEERRKTADPSHDKPASEYRNAS